MDVRGKSLKLTLVHSCVKIRHSFGSPTNQKCQTELTFYIRTNSTVAIQQQAINFHSGLTNEYLHPENVRDVSFKEACLCCMGKENTIKGCFLPAMILQITIGRMLADER
jgi:hypothetical protein